jgi:hypothetical protein
LQAKSAGQDERGLIAAVQLRLSRKELNLLLAFSTTGQKTLITARQSQGELKMKKQIIPALFAVGAMSLAAPALAQGYGPQGYGPQGAQNGWQSINGRQAQLDARIDQGIRNGTLTRAEAQRLRGEFNGIANLEARYRQTGGLDPRERADLDRRFDVLSAQVRIERADNQGRGQGRGQGVGQGNINARQAQLDRRIDRGVRTGSLNRTEAARIRAESRNIAVLETRYRNTGGGLDMRERVDLDRRFDALESRLRIELADRDFRWDDGYRYR